MLGGECTLVPNVCCAQVCAWEEVRRVESREYRELQSLYQESERRLKQVSKTPPLPQSQLKARNSFFTQTSTPPLPTPVIVGWPVSTLEWKWRISNVADFLSHSAAAEKKLSFRKSLLTVTWWFPIKSFFKLFSLPRPSLFTAVAVIPTQGGAMGVCDFQLFWDALQLPFKGFRITRILGECASKLPRLPFRFNTSLPRGDQPLYVLPSGRRGKVRGWKWHNCWISSIVLSMQCS